MRRQHLQNTKASAVVHSPSPIIEGNKIKSSIPPLIHDGGMAATKTFGFLFVYFLILILNF